jgi:Papain family cysteine protease
MLALLCASEWPDFKAQCLVDGGLGEARDQGQRGTCLAFATSAAHQVVRGDGTEQCVEWLFHGAKLRDGLTDDATTPAAVRAALKEEGQPAEAVWPYDKLRVHGVGSYAPPSLNGAACYKRSSSTTDAKVARLIQALDAGSVVVVGISLTSGFGVAPRGIVGGSTGHGPIVGAHAVLAIGHCVNVGDGATYLVVRNSWGPGWGAKGHCLIADAYLRRHILAAFLLN